MIHARTTYDVTCDTDGCPAVLEDVEQPDLFTGHGWLTVVDGGIWPGADAHYCPDHHSASRA